jgi:Origin recognition complex subunit 2
LIKLFLNGVQPGTLEGTKNCQYTSKEMTGTFHPQRSESPALDRIIAVARAIAIVAETTLIPIFIVIHNIESFRDRTAQSCLSALVANSQVSNGLSSIRLVCSVDHIDAPHVLWDFESLLGFQWIWKEVHSHRPYVRELAMLNDEGIMTQSQKSKIYKKSVKIQQSVRFLDVLGSLPPRTSEIAQILAELQLAQVPQRLIDDEEDNSSTEIWVDFKKFRVACKSKFAVSSDEELRKLMHELIDHRLIKKKSEGSAEYVIIPFRVKKLQEIIAFKR